MAELRNEDRCLFASLRNYRPSWLLNDVLAGLTLAAIAIPEQLATARLVGMPPMAGLLAFAAGSLAFAALGANRFMSVGADCNYRADHGKRAGGDSRCRHRTDAGMAAALAMLVGVVLLFAASFGPDGSPISCRSWSRPDFSLEYRFISSSASFPICSVFPRRMAMFWSASRISCDSCRMPVPYRQVSASGSLPSP